MNPYPIKTLLHVHTYFQCLPVTKFTIDIKLCRVGGDPSLILCPASIHSTVSIAHIVDGQDAGLGAKHGGGQIRVRGHYVPFQVPGDMIGLVSFSYIAHNHCRLSLIHRIPTKVKRNNLRSLCNMEIFSVPSLGFTIDF